MAAPDKERPGFPLWRHSKSERKPFLFNASLLPLTEIGRSRSMSEIAVFLSWRMFYKDTKVDVERSNKDQMLTLSSLLLIPDSLLAKEATDLLREHSTDLLFNHSIRVYLFAAEQGRQRKLHFDPELLYVAAAFHDFGLIKKFSSPDERFEVDGANAARQFLTAHEVPEEQVEIAWEAIALHTTPGVTHHMRPEVALLYSGVGLDVLGRGLDQFPSELREEIVARYPRKRFKEGFIQEYFAGFAHKPGTTYGTVNASICERLIPGYQTPNACDVIAASPFPDSE